MTTHARRITPRRPGFDRAACAVAWVAVAAYLAQHLRISENPVDGGLLLGYVRSLAAGGRPFHDFIDGYGPANWILPTLAYELAGERVLGIRVLLWAEKLGAVALAYGLVRQLADRFHAWLTVAWMTLLLGLPWPYLQDPYPFVPLAVAQLLSWSLLLYEPLRPRALNFALAGLLAGIALSTKVNTGAFLLAGGLFACLYFRPGVPEDTGVPGGTLRILRALGLPSFVVVFSAFIWPHLNILFFLYLIVPLLLLLAWAVPTLGRPASAAKHVAPCLIFAGVSVVVAASFHVVMIGPGALAEYFGVITAILTRADYASPFNPIGVAAELPGFNEHYWPQLLWTASLACAIVLVLRSRAGGAMSHDDRLLGSLWALHAPQLFVLYSRPDAAHVLQAMILAVPVLFVLLHRIGRRLWPGRQLPARVALGAVVAAGFLSLGALVPMDVLRRPGDWHNPRLAGIHYRLYYGPWMQPEERAFHRSAQEAIGETARFVDSITEDGEPMLLLNRSELLHFASNTRPATGRYRFLFYLVGSEIFGRADVEALMPPEVLVDLRENPPPVIVTSYGLTATAREFPELAVLLRERYTHRASFAHMMVYSRRS